MKKDLKNTRPPSTETQKDSNTSAPPVQNLLDRTFASAYPGNNEIDPEEERFAIRAAVRVLLRAKTQTPESSQRDAEGEAAAVGGRELIDLIKAEGSILSLKDVARVLHRAWREKYIHRALDRPHLQDARNSFVYWVDDTNRNLDSNEDGGAEAALNAGSINAAEPPPTNTHPHAHAIKETPLMPPSGTETLVQWMSKNGRKTLMNGVKIADVMGGQSAYALLEGVPRGRFARNFRDVVSVDRVLVYNAGKASYYAPVVQDLIEEDQPPESKNEQSALTLAPELAQETPLPLSEAPAFSPLELSEGFLRSYEAALSWRAKTGLAWPAEFMVDLIEQAAREARQITRERDHHRAVRRVVLAQTDLLRAAILLDEGAEDPALSATASE